MELQRALILLLVSVAAREIGAAQPGRRSSAASGVPSYTSWDGVAHRACPAACPEVEPAWPAQPAKSERKYSDEVRAKYREGMASGRIGGAMAHEQLAVTSNLTAFQHSMGYYGAVGEIGVHVGLYVLALAVHAAATEPLVAMDLFPGDPYKTTDRSGSADLNQFLDNCASVGLSPSDMNILAGDSRLLQPSMLTTRKIPKFRLLSVDGGHSLEIAMSDMHFATCAVMPGGVVTVDDITNMGWMGVFQAISLYVQCPNALAPFLLYKNKLYFTTVTHYALYMEWARKNFNCIPDNYVHVSRRSFGMFEVCTPELRH